MSKTDKAAQAKSRLCPEQEVIYNGIRIVVKPLRWGRVSDAIEAIEKIAVFIQQTILPQMTGGISLESLKPEIIGKLKGELFVGLNGLLNECVSIPEVPDATVEDLALLPMLEVLGIFYDQNIDLKNCQALIQRFSSQ